MAQALARAGETRPRAPRVPRDPRRARPGAARRALDPALQRRRPRSSSTRSSRARSRSATTRSRDDDTRRRLRGPPARGREGDAAALRHRPLVALLARRRRRPSTTTTTSIGLLKRCRTRTGDPVWADAAERFQLYETEPPAMTGTDARRAIVYPRPRTGSATRSSSASGSRSPRRWRSSSTARRSTATRGRGGWHTFRWTPPTSAPGTYTARLVARSLDGNPGATDARLVRRRARHGRARAGRGEGGRPRLLAREGRRERLLPDPARAASGAGSTASIAPRPRERLGEDPARVLARHRRRARRGRQPRREEPRARRRPDVVRNARPCRCVASSALRNGVRPLARRCGFLKSPSLRAKASITWPTTGHGEGGIAVLRTIRVVAAVAVAACLVFAPAAVVGRQSSAASAAKLRKAVTSRG